MVDYGMTRDQKTFSEQLAVRETVGNYYVSLLGMRDYDTTDLVRLVREGLSYSALEKFEQNSSIPKDQLQALLQLPLRTQQRRKKEGSLHADESDRLLRAARVFAQVVALFGGDFKSAQFWFSKPLAILGGTSPLEFASSELGAREVETIIGRLEHGIPL